MRRCALPLLLTLLAAGASGRAAAEGLVAPISDARSLFDQGRYLDAAQLAAGARDSADCQALAAKAYAAAAYLADDRVEADLWTDAALAHAEAAVALEPDHVEGRLQLAAALWLRSRSVDSWEAYRKGMPQRGRALIEAAAKDSPQDPEAYAMLGAWHFEALRRGGRMAHRMLGADLEAGEEAFRRAQSLDPGDAAIATQAGLFTLALDPDRYADEAADDLERALALPPKDAFDRAMQARARDALGLIRAHDGKALEAELDRWFGG